MDSPSVNTEAASAPASAADKLAAFEEFLGPDEEQDDTETEAESEDDLSEDDLLEDEEAGEEGDEPETAIEAPISLNAEEKKAFAAASPEAQQAWAAAETRRNAQVQEATTKASLAQRDAEARAAAADAEAKSLYARQLDQFIGNFEPVMPDPNLAQYDPATYIAQKAQYDAAKAQHDQLVQQVRGIQSEANAEANAAFVAQRDRELMTIPEVANPETRSSYLDRAMDMAEQLGYAKHEIAGNITAAEIKSLAQVADWKAKAERFDKAMSSKMQRVRSAKSRSVKPNAAPHADARAAGSDKSWQRVKTARNKGEQASAFADFLGL